MGNMRFKVGDRVQIKSVDWYNKNKDKHGIVICGMMPFCGYMSCRCGTIVTISEILEWGYTIEEDYGENGWTDEMIEGLVEEGMSLDKAGQITDFEYEGLAYTLPDGYQFKDENGNVINATKIVLEKKEKEYPKTFLECCDVLNIGNLIERGVKGYKSELLDTFQKLLICRDAYWKIYGEEMGLGKPWKPDCTTDDVKHSLVNVGNTILPSVECKVGRILTFPTEEMRDAFYENFKELIEMCKELL